MDTGSEPPRPLDDLQVVELATQIAGPYCTKLFVDAGAEVIKFEPSAGDPLRRYAATVDLPPGETGALFRYLNAGKRSMVGTIDDPRLDDLLAGADLLVVDHTMGEPDYQALHTRHPHLVVVSITPFGRTGPLAGRAATDLTLQAESGAIMFKGASDRPPVQAGGRVSEYFGGLFAAPGALAAVMRARATGRGESIDVSIHDVLAIAGSNYSHVLHALLGRPEPTAPMRYIDTPGIEDAADGMVAFNTNAGHMFQMFLLLVERPDLMDDPEYASIANRLAMGADWQRIVDSWVASHTVAEVLDQAGELRVPVAPVHDGESVLHDEHLVARGVLLTDDEGLVRPRPPYLIDGSVMGSTDRGPTLGEHDASVFVRPRTHQVAPDGDLELPLTGLKVVDLTSWWVGALATQILAMLGADVVHIEGVAHPDGMRLTGARLARSDDWWEWGHMFAAANTNKRGVTLDLSTEKGRGLLDDLITWADVLVENFSPRVAESWGLGPDAVFARNPGIVYQRMPAYGLTGPWRDRPAFAQTIEPMSTMASITGYPDAKPVSKGGIPDPTAGAHGAWAALVAIAEQHRRKAGVFCEAVMIEAALNVSAQPLLEHGAYNRTMSRLGNRSPHAAPQGVYACAGIDSWLAVSATSDEQWVALATIIGGEPLAHDPRYASARGRHENHDDLDALLQSWAACRIADEAGALLAAHGVPAAACRDPRTIEDHEQYRARQLFAEVDHPRLGRHRVPGLPYRFASSHGWVRSPAPTFGQHNAEVLRAVSGLTERDLAELADTGVIADRPRGL